MSFKVILVTILTCPVLILPQDEINVPTTNKLSTTSQPNLTCSVIKSVANCSNRGLPDVPTTLPATITVLLMDHNKVKNLTSKNFARFENLTHLDISHNIIKQVADDSFGGLTHLQCLHMEGNRVQCADKALSVLHSLEELCLDGSSNMTFGEHFQNLTKLTSLSLSGHEGECKLYNIYNNTFEYVPHLKLLNLTYCDLRNIEAGAFVPLRRIEVLDISDNYYMYFRNFQNVTYGLINSSIQILKANSIVKPWSVCNILYKEHLQHLKNTGLQKLFIDHNRLEVFGTGTLLTFPESLWYISARSNLFTFGPYVYELKQMTNVTHLYLGQNLLQSLPYFPHIRHKTQKNIVLCDTDSDSICQYRNRYKSIYNQEPIAIPPPSPSSQNSKPKPMWLIVPPNLQVLALPCEKVSFNIGWTKVTANNITTIDISCNWFSQWTGPVEGLEKLEILDLSHNTAQYVSRHFFSSFPQLKKLNISSNNVGFVTRMRNDSLIFDNLTSLEVLDMSFNDIHSLPDNIFQDLVSVKTINLSFNSLYLDLPLRVAHMKNLQLLDLSNNQIRWFSDVLMQDLDTLAASHNVTVHMIYNPISCTCSNLDFLNWMKSSRVLFTKVHNYTCAFEDKTFSPMGQFEDTVNRLQKECSTHLGLVLGCVFVIVIVLVIISGAMAYRYRWNMRYWYYAARLRLKSELLVDEEGESFTFYAFVSHADEDEDFVVDEMRNRLETEESGINLNIHHRDFIPGQDIASNILSAIQRSRKTVVVLSRYFLESYWCMYELQMANMESIKTGRDVLIIIMYEDISTRKIPKEVLYHLKTDSYITYPRYRDEDQVDLFWRRLIAAIKNT
ncbi:toll-like receptor 4 [Gigantopelta aegis]|uniref:toll-like receptor 4 n=1 Tax=Gigantopelta aegis TaxID=1735272 RepID=UPI001B8894ED|nr:toll-like receptor 4 [Gigantopelta aegis]